MKSGFRHILSAVIGMGALITPIQLNAASLVELYTSQGCSSCPGADLFMTDLGARDDVIPLAFHVDYWDYLGWTDEFGKSEFSERQAMYQQARQEKQIFTPQVIVNGRHSFSGANTDAIENSFKLNDAPADLKMTTTSNGKVSFTAFASNGKEYSIMLAHVLPTETVEITEGENAGKLIEYTNVVGKLEKLADWDGVSAVSVNTNAEAGMSLVIFVQEENYGSVVFAEKLNN